MLHLCVTYRARCHPPSKHATFCIITSASGTQHAGRPTAQKLVMASLQALAAAADRATEADTETAAIAAPEEQTKKRTRKATPVEMAERKLAQKKAALDEAETVVLSIEARGELANAALQVAPILSCAQCKTQYDSGSQKVQRESEKLYFHASVTFELRVGYMKTHW